MFADFAFELILAYDKIQITFFLNSLPNKHIGTAVWLPVVIITCGLNEAINLKDIKKFFTKFTQKIKDLPSTSGFKNLMLYSCCKGLVASMSSVTIK